MNINSKLSVQYYETIEEILSLKKLLLNYNSHYNNDIDYFINIAKTKNGVVKPLAIVFSCNNNVLLIILGRLEYDNLKLNIGYSTFVEHNILTFNIIYNGFIELGVIDYDFVLHQLNKLATNYNAIQIKFNKLNTMSPISRHLNKDRIQKHKVHKHWKIKLKNDLNLFLTKYKYKRKKEFKRIYNKIIINTDFKIKKYTQSNDLLLLLSDVNFIASKSYHRGIGAGFIDNPTNRSRISYLAKSGLLLSYVLYHKETPCCFWIGTVFNNTCYLNYTSHLIDFKEYQPGIVLLLYLINDLSSVNTVSEIDFGFGDAFYKEKLSDYCFLEADYIIFIKTIKGFYLKYSYYSFKFINQLLHYSCNKLNITNKIKKTWRNILRNRSE